MVFKVARLQFYFMVYIWKNKYKGGYSIKKGLDRYMKRQQECLDTQGRTLDKKNNSRNNDAKKEQDDRKFKSIKGNTKK